MTTISLPRFARSIRHAMHGLKHAFISENNFRIHSIIAVIVLIATVILKLSRAETVTIVLVITSVLVLELVNTIVERFADLLEPRIHPYVHVIKDMMAASVVLAAGGAVVVGILIFWPYIFS